ncbi:type I-E CRISPR-associated protein Cse1/CasA [Sandaracinobacter neustonicus]|uniref:Type I-E CRISPR-associated protein Cse1/CasA n=1 Tax=Sandaracinobacter neustonicus TaxID=1715348 RepID=A0A501XW46_9SPHN|nr:type I-E CRISPR-associated protein Cse1/CasA [Sandaracinobacter neustonicus]TPE64800.1 type I-E CRISPR-associated protein Cse1/CasA [Sandaracinobacter neustonicus]
MNLLWNSWIPVRTLVGRRCVRPSEVASPWVEALDWPRADLNLACLEFLIGLVAAADPPEDAEDWEVRREPDMERLSARLEALAPAFDLLGDGPRFLQELGGLEGEPNPPDMLFIDSAGANAVKKNADLMVHGGRYPALDLPTAAMALYLLQSHAPSGGAGNRTSLRGGGPMVTLVDPGTGRLWDMIWANVPYRPQGEPYTFPWMRPARTSERGEVLPPDAGDPLDAFFAMPRRLWLVAEGDVVTGVIQRPWGGNYLGWVHPLTPYYRVKEGAELLPVHPRPGRFSYRNWLGVVMASTEQNRQLRQRAKAVETYEDRLPLAARRGASLLVGGWAMNNMQPMDFTLSRQPLLPLNNLGQARVRGMIEASELLWGVLRSTLRLVVGEESALDALREDWFTATEETFDRLVRHAGDRAVGADWLAALRRKALSMFDREALSGLTERPIEDVQLIVKARQILQQSFAGFGKPGAETFRLLELPLPERKARAEVQV